MLISDLRADLSCEMHRDFFAKSYIADVPEVGKVLFVIGLIIAGVGLFIWAGIGRGWFGQLPGDVNVSRPGFSFHFPIVTCLVISLILTVVMWLVRR